MLDVSVGGYDDQLGWVGSENSRPSCWVSNEVLFPRVNVGSRGGQRIEFSRDDFRLVDSRRVPGARVKRVQFGHAGEKYALRQSALEGVLPFEPRREAMVPGIDLGMRTADSVQRVISLEREYAAAAAATSAASYDASHRKALGAAARWDKVAGNPTGDVADAIEVVRQAIGQAPRTVVLGAKVFAAVRKHAATLEQIYGDAGQRLGRAEDLAKLWDVDTVAVGRAVYTDEVGVTSDVWGKVAIVAFTEVGTVEAPEPSFGHGDRLNGLPVVAMPYYEQQCLSWIYPVVEEWSCEVVGEDTGYLLTTVVD